jgi:hypothetical protein
MEIKIVCGCGTRFSFEVEPVNGRMPAPVNCPSCGADGTAQANDTIRMLLAPPQAPAAPASTAAPMRVTLPQPAPSLRISRPAAPPPAAEAPEAPITEAPPPIAAGLPRRPSVPAESKPKSQVVQVLTLIVTTVLIIFGVWKFGAKWFGRLKVVQEIATVAGEASVNQSKDSEGAKNLWYDNCSILFIRATNHLQVAEACQQYWKEKWNKRVSLIDTPREVEEKGEYELISAHNGYVRIVGAHEWPLPEFEGLAQRLSQNFGAQVFEWRSESFADTYHFGVYDKGARKFHAQMDVKIANENADEIVTTQGDEFAIANGYKPGPEGFKEFNVLDADKITQRLGMKLWDEPEGKELKGMILKEVAR